VEAEHYSLDWHFALVCRLYHMNINFGETFFAYRTLSAVIVTLNEKYRMLQFLCTLLKY